jgi:hypothetical protein
MLEEYEPTRLFLLLIFAIRRGPEAGLGERSQSSDVAVLHADSDAYTTAGALASYAHVAKYQHAAFSNILDRLAMAQ